MSTTTDKELLELAAKAVGLKYHAYVDSELFGRGINTGELETPLWNPLTDDGDALRLAVHLHIDIKFRLDCDMVLAADCVENLIKMDGDLEATRRAIVRAAAEVGKAMP